MRAAGVGNALAAACNLLDSLMGALLRPLGQQTEGSTAAAALSSQVNWAQLVDLAGLVEGSTELATNMLRWAAAVVGGVLVGCTCAPSGLYWLTC